MVSPKDLTSPSAVVMEWVDGAVVNWGGYRLSLRKVEGGWREGEADAYYFDLGVAARSWVLRGWVNGDEMRGFGGVQKKLSDWFVDEKIESFAKPFVPLLVGAEGVLCAVGMRRSALYPVGEDAGSYWVLSWEVL
jgi:hypothetical protein